MRQASGRFTEAGISRELFVMDAHLKECNHGNSDRWSLEPLYAVRPDRYPAHTVPQPGVGQITRNEGHGQHANGSRKAPGGNEGRCGSTLRQSIAIMGGKGSKMANYGNGLDVIGRWSWKCVSEKSLALANCPLMDNMTTSLVDGL